MKLFINVVMKRIYLFNTVAWNYRKNIGFPVCKKENFVVLREHRKRGKSARAIPTSHHTLLEERSARFIAQPLSAPVYALEIRRTSRKITQLSCTCTWIFMPLVLTVKKRINKFFFLHFCAGFMEPHWKRRRYHIQPNMYVLLNRLRNKTETTRIFSDWWITQIWTKTALMLNCIHAKLIKTFRKSFSIKPCKGRV